MPGIHCSPRHRMLQLRLNSVAGLVSKIWYRTPFDQSELSNLGISPTHSPKVQQTRRKSDRVALQ